MEDFDLDTDIETDVEEALDSDDGILSELEDIPEYDLDEDIETDISGPEFELPQDYLEEFVDNTDDKESLSRLKDLLESGTLGVETDDIDEEDTEKILSLGRWKR